MNDEKTRREFLRSGGLATAGLFTATAAQAAQEQDKPEEHAANADQEFPREQPGPGGPVGSGTDRGKLVAGYRDSGEDPVLVETPDVPKLYWEMKNGVKEYHLVAQVVRREFLPNMWFWVWGFNGSMPGPTIEAVEGDRIRIVVHNELPEATTIHWHGIELPNRMDGVHGVTQEPIMPGKEFVYEFDLHQNGTFFYHSHGPMQEVMGMAGLLIVHPRSAHYPVVDHDFGLILQEWAILPQSDIPNSLSEEFNFFTINGRAGPYTTPMVTRLGSRVRLRFMNLSAMDSHPMHLHGHTFWVTGTEGGRIPDSAWIPGNNVIVHVGQSRDVEFIANNPGDWMVHCHILHHMMNHMVSMVGPMAGHMMRGMPAGGDMANSLGMIQLGTGASPLEELGPSLGRGMGPQTSDERQTMTGMAMGNQNDPRHKVPGFPQDMMEMHGMMHSEDEMKKINKPQARGMRRNWFTGVQGMMTIVRVLPSDLYDRVLSDDAHVEPGESVPGGGEGMDPQQGGKMMHEGHGASNGKQQQRGQAEKKGANAGAPAADKHRGHK